MDSKQVEQVIDVVVAELTSRRGFRQVWESLDVDMKGEVRAELGVRLREIDIAPAKVADVPNSEALARAKAALLLVAESKNPATTATERVAAAQALIGIATGRG